MSRLTKKEQPKMSYQHPSGATKRKRKREEMLNLKNQAKKLIFFCNPAPNRSQFPELKSPRSKDGFQVAGRTHDTSVNEGNIEPQSSEGCSAIVLLLLLQSKRFIPKLSKLKMLKQ